MVSSQLVGVRGVGNRVPLARLLHGVTKAPARFMLVTP